MNVLKHAIAPVALAALMAGCGGPGGPQEKNVWIPVSDGDTYYYLDKKGDVVTPEVAVKETSVFYDDYAVVRVDGRSGYLGRDGKLAIPAEYLRATRFSEGLAFVRKEDKPPIQAIDKAGEVVFTFPNEVSDARRFSEGLAAFEMGYKWGYVDRIGKVVIEPAYAKAGDFSNGLAFTNKGYVDKNGAPAFEADLDTGGPFSAKGYAVVSTYDRRGVQYGVINRKGEYVIAASDIYANILADGDEFIVYENDGDHYLAGRINEAGKPSVDFDYEDIKPFGGSKYAGARPEFDDAFGIIDLKGQIIVEPQFAQFVSSFKGGMAVVRNGYRSGDGMKIINEKGETLMDLEYPATVSEDFITGGRYDSIF